MTIEIKTSKIEPVRHTYAHVARRFGDKPASRYQEATYDVAASINFHYKPLWDPDHELNDPGRTAVTMSDWYAIKDPRQFYYGTYVQNRAGMQEKAESNFSFFEKRNLGERLPEAVKQKIVTFMLPLRHVEQTANLNNLYCCACANHCLSLYQGMIFEGMDRLGNAQYYSRIGLALDGNSGDSLVEAKGEWMDNPAWQGLRAYCEKTLTVKDWFETFIAQDVVLDALLGNLYYVQFDNWLAENDGRDISMLTDFMQTRATDASRWIDNVLKQAVNENEANADLIRSWISTWRIRAQTALEPLASTALDDNALPEAFAALEARLKKIGLSE